MRLEFDLESVLWLLASYGLVESVAISLGMPSGPQQKRWRNDLKYQIPVLYAAAWSISQSHTLSIVTTVAWLIINRIMR